MKHIVIPDTVTTFGEVGVVQHCEALESIVIGNGITETAGSELSGCPKLESVYISSSVKKINPYSFASGGYVGGNELKTVVIPEGLTSLGGGAFSNCTNLEAVILPKSLKDISNFGTFKADDKPLPKLFIYGYAGTQAETFANEGGFPFVDISVAKPTNSRVIIDGKEVAFTAYEIGGNNYFKLRDVAKALNGSSKNFNVGWDGNNNAISLTSKKGYTSVGGELVVNSNTKATEPIISNPKIFVDGKLTTFMAFGINDNNYIKLRDLGEVFDFAVDWDNNTQTISINTSKGY